MKMELLLQNVNQDQTAQAGSVDAFYGWMHGPASGGDGDKLPLISLRKEDWGGIFIYGPTQSVYIVDAIAYSLLERLKSGEAKAYIKANPNGVLPSDLDHFILLLEKHGISEGS